MTRVLSRRRIMVRRAGGAEALEAWCAGGLALVEAEAPDEAATLAAQLDGHFGIVARRGLVVLHEASSARLTPAGWLLPDLDAGRACLAALLDDAAHGKKFDGPVAAIERLGPLVEAAHRRAGCWQGARQALADLDGAIDDAAFEARIAELRAAPACEAFRTRTGRAVL